jgi:hypothetical protein
MIIKHAEGRARDITELERLRAIAPARAREKIDEELRKIRKGEAGERSAAHFLDRDFGRSDCFAILHDLRLELDGQAAQIDHLVIHRYQARAWVLESKSYGGQLSCNEHGDWTVWYGKLPKAISSPVAQARRQAELLTHWLSANKLPGLREIERVVLISPDTSINRKKSRLTSISSNPTCLQIGGRIRRGRSVSAPPFPWSRNAS